MKGRHCCTEIYSSTILWRTSLSCLLRDVEEITGNWIWTTFYHGPLYLSQGKKTFHWSSVNTFLFTTTQRFFVMWRNLPLLSFELENQEVLFLSSIKARLVHLYPLFLLQNAAAAAAATEVKSWRALKTSTSLNKTSEEYEDVRSPQLDSCQEKNKTGFDRTDPLNLSIKGQAGSG